MIITKAQVKNFRCLHDIEVTLSRMTTIAGADFACFEHDLWQQISNDIGAEAL
jgi:hypothetical protein